VADQKKQEQDINDIKNAINSISYNVRRIERVLAHERYLPTRQRTIRYFHKKRQLVFDKRYVMQFEKNEADLMGTLFFEKGKKAGQPKTSEIPLGKIAKDNEILNLNPKTKKAVYSALKRINDRVLEETRIELFRLSFNTIQFNEFANRNIEM
jgi:hypothetical protein